MVILLRDRVLDSVDAHVALMPAMLELTVDVPYPGATEVEQISVKRMRDMLLDPGVPSEVRDSIWSRLLRTSREKRDPWDVVTIWMMAPGLRRICWNCRRFGFVADLAELEAEAVSAFLVTARSADPDRPELGAWLWSATYRHVRRAVPRPRCETPTADIELVQALDASPFDASRAIAAFQRLVDDTAPAVEQSGDGDPVKVEGERLGAVAQRLGLRLPPGHAGSRAEGEAA
ncbi:hypothetical protein [Parafrankia sp. EUN1f]|uniref:hypothetical protein n=1 Tax=Parafrankia sp. EUN1f TaxID=102897 RepID=UPI0001C44238|nr:hypothetical protein [Parafrankia sp. EUN1f]EFC85800.1 hypothetical protein FrEUN1fDRAFT_1119 [Parafrankia sp. EUN1f]